MKPRGGEGQNGRLKCPVGFLVSFSDQKAVNYTREDDYARGGISSEFL